MEKSKAKTKSKATKTLVGVLVAIACAAVIGFGSFAAIWYFPSAHEAIWPLTETSTTIDGDINTETDNENSDAK